MFSENHDESTLREFPAPKRLFDLHDAPTIGCLPEALRIFRNVAGYDLQFIRPGSKEATCDSSVMESRCDGDDVSPFKRVATFPIGEPGRRVYGSLKLTRDPDSYPRVEWDAARALAAMLAAILSENYFWHEELMAREGELAALVVDAPKEGTSRSSVSSRLRDVLRSGATALGGFSAAALYLLDEKTSSLKARAVWGLPDDRHLDPPRPLRGARAEIEALMGSAVILNNDYLAEAWKAPETFLCSVCIPVVSETTILGVVWFFSDVRHKIATRELETLNLVAWRLVDELEKESSRVTRRPRSEATPKTPEQADGELREWIDSILNAKK